MNLAPALLGVPVYIFFTATFIGIIPGTFAFAFLGSGLESIIDNQRSIYDMCVAEKGGFGLHVFAFSRCLDYPGIVSGIYCFGCGCITSGCDKEMAAHMILLYLFYLISPYEGEKTEGVFMMIREGVR